MTEVIIADEALDLSPDTVVAVTKQVNDIGELKDIWADGTEDFDVLNTAKNSRLLGNPNQIANADDTPYIVLNAKVLQDGVEVLPNGKALVMSAGDKYKLQVTSGNKNFFQEIEGKSIRDLDLSAYDHNWNLATEVASRTNTAGYIYPITAMRELNNTNNNFDAESQLPAVFIHTIWSKIAEEAGFTWGGEFLSTSFFNNLILLWSEGKSPANSEEFMEDSLFSVFKIPDQIVVNGDTDKVTFEGETSDPGNNFNLSTDKYIVPGNGLYKFRYNHRISYPFGSTINPRLRIRQNGTTFVNTLSLTSAPVPIFSTTEETTFIALSVGDEIELFCQAATGAPNDTNIQQLTWSLIEIQDMTASYGGFYEIARNLPDIKQTEFIKGIAGMFSIIFSTDPYTKIVSARRLDEITENQSEAIDWSGKLDLSDKYNVEFKFGDYGQISWFRYKEDSNPSAIYQLGDGSFQVANDNLSPEVTVIDLPFAASPMTVALEGLDLPVAIVFETGEFIDSIEPRILILDRQDNANGVNYTDSSTSSLITTDLPLCYFDLPDKTVGLSYDHTILADHWQALQSMLNQVKKVTAYFKLSQADMAGLDHFKPIYVEYFGNRFYVNKVENYVPGKSTKCHLIRL